MMSENKLSAKKLHELKSKLGMKTTPVVEYPLPRPNDDVLDVGRNITKYGRAKHILESPDINQILQSMDAFSAINIYDIDSYVNLGESVASAINYILETHDDAELDVVGKEFIIEADNALGGMVNKFVGGQMDSKPGEEQGQDGEEQGQDGKNRPDGALDKITNMFDVGGWIEKLAAKLGISAENIKGMMYAYFTTKLHKGKEEAGPDASGRPSDDGGRPSGDGGERMNGGQAQFARESIEEPEEVIAEAHENPKQEDVTGPKMPANVKSDVNKRIKELKQLMSDFESKKHFYGEKKPAIFNAKKSLEFIMDKCKSGNMLEFKEAQLHLQKLMGPITDLFPPSLVRYLATGKDDGKDKFNNPI
jgi:hypothetical protein